MNSSRTAPESVTGGGPAPNPLHVLQRCGQSIWLDSISRSIIRSGRLRGLVEEDGITGITANPTIFEKAIVGTQDYDDAIRELAATGYRPIEIYEALAIQDVAAAADILRPAHDRCGGCDGFASIEVSPALAHDTSGTIEEALRFWQRLDRLNVMVKVPATSEGIPAIEELTFRGVNVNVTLIFSVGMYDQVIDAYLRGLERRLQRGLPLSHVASVASFFVSRVDTLIDRLLEEQAEKAEIERLKGKAAIANAKIAYGRFERVFGSDRFRRLARRGAQKQRPLWASTGVKNPAYPDTLYVDPLIGPHTINTMPMETIAAVRDHAKPECGAIRQGMFEAHAVMEDLRAAGVDMQTVTDRLTAEGVEKFCASLTSLLKSIEQREGSLLST